MEVHLKIRFLGGINQYRRGKGGFPKKGAWTICRFKGGGAWQERGGLIPQCILRYLLEFIRACFHGKFPKSFNAPWNANFQTINNVIYFFIRWSCYVPGEKATIGIWKHEKISEAYSLVSVTSYGSWKDLVCPRGCYTFIFHRDL